MRQIEHFNFNWKYKNNFDKKYIHKEYDDIDFEIINLPHSNKTLPYNNINEKDYQFESCYRKTFTPSTYFKDKLVFLCFGAVMSYCIVYVNGIHAGEHKGGYTPFKLNITEYVKFDEENCITIYVDSNERKEIPPFGYVIDYLTYGGIYREVRIEYCSEIFIENCLIKTTNVQKDKKTLSLDVYIANPQKNRDNLLIKSTIKKEDKIVRSSTEKIKLTKKTVEKYSFNYEISDIDLWDVDNPNLYHLTIELEMNDDIIDSQAYRFGFREVEFTNEGFFLNGKKIKLRGLNRHQSFPYSGYAMPKSAQYKDAEILKKELGVNTVRLSHYPQSDHFLDRCDELGILVFDEIPGWQHIGEAGDWWQITKQHVEEMIKKDWNHPSVFIWGVRINESQDCDKLYKQTNEIARRLDSTRPTGGVRCIRGSKLLEDVYTYNDFIHNGIKGPLDKRKNVTKKTVPYLITEHNGHMFPTKKFDDTAHRVEHALRHLRVLDAMYGDTEIAGSIGWCMFDYNTHKEFGSGDKICYHGVMDMFRIPKYAASVYASQQDQIPVMTVLSSMDNGDLEGSIRGDVYIFSNCNSIRMYINNTFIKEFYPRKDLFTNIPHAPFIIDDFIGNQIKENERFSEKDAETVKKLLSKINRSGGQFGLADKMVFTKIALKYKMNKKDAEDLYSKYFAGWGSASTEYKFEGLIAGKRVITQTKSQVFKPELSIEIDSDILTEEETYDTTRVVLKLKNEYGDDIIYANDVFKLSIEGEAEIIGPKMIALIGGSRAFWIKSNGKAGEVLLRIESERFGTTTKMIQIIKSK